MPPGPLHVPRPLLDEVLATVVKCGDDRNECVVYVTGNTGTDRSATGFIHPRHAATPVSTKVDGAALDHVWDTLLERNQRIVLQLHSHPGAAHHSGIDDGWPVIHRVGFPSLVVASFGRVGLKGAHLAIHLGGGVWRDVEPATWSEYLVINDVAKRPQSEQLPQREEKGLAHPR